MKFLIVDDNSQMRDLTRIYLQSMAKEIRECADGSEALAVYQTFLPDWVLMDWEMKQMNGLTAIKEILKLFPAAQIVLFTQFDDDELHAAALSAGARGLILKDNLSALQGFFGQRPV